MHQNCIATNRTEPDLESDITAENVSRLLELVAEVRSTKDGEYSKPITKARYLLGLLIILGAAYSQYIFGGFGPAVGLLVVYGFPCVYLGASTRI